MGEFHQGITNKGKNNHQKNKTVFSLTFHFGKRRISHHFFPRYLYTVPKIRFMYSQELCCLVPNSYIHVLVSNLYILMIWLQQIRQTDPGNIEIACGRTL